MPGGGRKDVGREREGDDDDADDYDEEENEEFGENEDRRAKPMREIKEPKKH